MIEDKILCHQCGKDLVMKFIELKDLVFCSSACFENFKGSMSRKDFFKNYGDGFTPDEKRWVPKYSNDYIKMCGYCPKKLAETCHEEGQEAKAFSQAFASLAQRLGRNLRSVDRGHPILKIHHLFAAVPSGLAGPAMLMEDQGMVYSDGDFGCIWAGGRGDRPMPREAIREALELGVNIAVYAHERAHYHALRILAK